MNDLQIPAVPEDPVQMMLDVLELSSTEARTSEDIFVGDSHWMMNGRVYGGQVMAQAAVAAQRTIDGGRDIHSMHGYFLRPGDTNRTITFAVDRIHDGRSFATRRTQAYQEGMPILSMIASFQTDDGGPEAQSPMPRNMPSPEDLPTAEETLRGFDHPMAEHWSQGRPFDFRHVEGPLWAPNERYDPDSGMMHVWVKAKRELPDDDALQRASLVYMSDAAILEPIMRRHRVTWLTPGIKMASLDHAIWWHRPTRVDEWLLLRMHTTSSGGGRGLAHCRVFNREGVHVASFAQEGMVRIPVEQEAAR